MFKKYIQPAFAKLLDKFVKSDPVIQSCIIQTAILFIFFIIVLCLLPNTSDESPEIPFEENIANFYCFGYFASNVDLGRLPINNHDKSSNQLQTILDNAVTHGIKQSNAVLSLIVIDAINEENIHTGCKRVILHSFPGYDKYL